MKIKTIFILLLIINNLHAKESKLTFIENKRQWDDVVKFKADIEGGTLFITDQGLTYSFYNTTEVSALLRYNKEKRSPSTSLQSRKRIQQPILHRYAYRINFSGNRPAATYTTEEKQTAYYNFILGNHADHWASNVRAYRKVIQHNVYPGIDAAFYSEHTAPKYDFIVSAGADPGQIILNFEAVTPQLTSKGTLSISTTVNELEEGKPYAYQWLEGKKQEVVCRYKQLSLHDFTYEFPNGYDKSRPLIIDPALIFCSYSGSPAEASGIGASYDKDGALYLLGSMINNGWPTTVGAFQSTLASSGSTDAVISKYSSDGTTLLYATYFGGLGDDTPQSIITNDQNEPVIIGTTASGDLPITSACFQNTLGNTAGLDIDFFVAHFSQDGGSLVGSTYVGGSGWDCAYNNMDLNLDRQENILVCGTTPSADFPITATAAQNMLKGGNDAVVFCLNPSCQQLLYSSYLGGGNEDNALAVASTPDNNIIIGGLTYSTDLPVTQGVFNSSYIGAGDGFVSILDKTSGIIHSSYVGTADYDYVEKLAVDISGNIVTMGFTNGSYTVTPGVYNMPNPVGYSQHFMDHLQSDLSASIRSTRICPSFLVTAFYYDSCGYTYVAGYGNGDGFPVTNDAYQNTATNSFWMGVFDFDWAGLKYGTFLGNENYVDASASRFSPNGVLYEAVSTTSTTLPTDPGVYAPTKLSSALYHDAACFKFDMSQPKSPIMASFGIAEGAAQGCVPLTISFDNTTTGGTAYEWDFGDGNTSTAFEPMHTFTQGGTYSVKLKAKGDCNVSDSAYLTIKAEMVDTPRVQLNDTTICSGSPILIRAITNNTAANSIYEWGPKAAILSSNGNTARVNPTSTHAIYLKVTNGGQVCPISLTDSMQLSYCTCDLLIPNAFSPNGDGLNDLFLPTAKKECLQTGKYTLDIYDRWGNRVFSGNTGNGWNGTFRGMPCASGTYFYRISYLGGVNQDELTYKGDISLIR